MRMCKSGGSKLHLFVFAILLGMLAAPSTASAASFRKGSRVQCQPRGEAQWRKGKVVLFDWRNSTILVKFDSRKRIVLLPAKRCKPLDLAIGGELVTTTAHAKRRKAPAAQPSSRPACYGSLNFRRWRRFCEDGEQPLYRGFMMADRRASKATTKLTLLLAHEGIKRRWAGLDRCYDSQLQRTPGLMGTVTIAWTLPMTIRRVANVHPVGPMLTDGVFEACLVKALHRMPGPIDPERRPESVTYAFLFRPHTSPPLVTPPRVLTQLKVEWPPRARKRSKRSKPVAVSLMLTVDRKGRVQKSKVTKGAGRKFNKAATSWAKQVTFTPGTRDGKLAVLPVAWTVTFVPPSEGKTP